MMTIAVREARSSDQTLIAYEERGSGPPLVLVHGSVCDRTYWAPILGPLCEHFTVYSIDRRGRGASADGDHYDIALEADDVVAVIDQIGQPTHLLGHSYGGIVALEAALQIPDLRTLTLYEPPFVDGNDAVSEEFTREVERLVAARQQDAAVELMMGELVGLPADDLAELRSDAAAWQPMVDSVHTLPRELRSVAAFAFDRSRYGSLEVPTNLLRGELSPADLSVGVNLVQDAVSHATTITMYKVDHEAVTTGPSVLVETILTALAD